jgi:hypothetical protein
MRLTIIDRYDALTGTRRPRLDESTALLAGVAYSYVLQTTGLTTTKELSELIVEPILAALRGEERDSSGIAYRWAAGQLISRKWRVRLEPHVPGLTALCDHPVFPLLKDYPITTDGANRCLSRWRGGATPYWKFDDELRREVEFRQVTTLQRDDTQSLMERGDLDGFTVILGLMRYAEAAKDSTANALCARDLYRAFPAIARVPWFKENRKLLRLCVQLVHRRDSLSCWYWGVDWDVINAQIDAEAHETIRRLCPRDPTGRFIPPKDPVRAMVDWPDNVFEEPYVAARHRPAAKRRSRGPC